MYVITFPPWLAYIIIYKVTRRVPLCDCGVGCAQMAPELKTDGAGS